MSFLVNNRYQRHYEELSVFMKQCESSDGYKWPRQAVSYRSSNIDGRSVTEGSAVRKLSRSCCVSMLRRSLEGSGRNGSSGLDLDLFYTSGHFDPMAALQERRRSLTKNIFFVNIKTRCGSEMCDNKRWPTCCCWSRHSKILHCVNAKLWR